MQEPGTKVFFNVYPEAFDRTRKGTQPRDVWPTLFLEPSPLPKDGPASVAANTYRREDAYVQGGLTKGTVGAGMRLREQVGHNEFGEHAAWEEQKMDLSFEWPIVPEAFKHLVTWVQKGEKANENSKHATTHVLPLTLTSVDPHPKSPIRQYQSAVVKDESGSETTVYLHQLITEEQWLSNFHAMKQFVHQEAIARQLVDVVDFQTGMVHVTPGRSAPPVFYTDVADKSFAGETGIVVSVWPGTPAGMPCTWPLQHSNIDIPMSHCLVQQSNPALFASVCLADVAAFPDVNNPLVVHFHNVPEGKGSYEAMAFSDLEPIQEIDKAFVEPDDLFPGEGAAKGLAHGEMTDEQLEWDERRNDITPLIVNGMASNIEGARRLLWASGGLRFAVKDTARAPWKEERGRIMGMDANELVRAPSTH